MSSNWSKSWRKDYDVGYRKPPKHKQFQPGQSGNRKGRPKVEKTIQDVLIESLNKAQVVKDHGKTKSMTKKEVIVNVLITESMKANTRAIQLLFKLAQDSNAWNKLSKEDRSMIIKFVEPDKDEKNKKG